MRFQYTILSIILLSGAVTTSHAQNDAQGAVDHPLVSRYQGSTITGYSQKEFEKFTYPTSANLVNYNKLKDFRTLEGQLTNIEYVAPKGVTTTQLFRTYQTQLRSAGFTEEFSCQSGECGSMPMHFVREYIQGSSRQIGNSMVGEKNSAYLAASGSRDGQSYLVSIVMGDYGNDAARYAISIVRKEILDENKVDIQSVTERINATGRYAFYEILFDSNSATLKEGSSTSIEIIADFLDANPSKSVLIVGHTDNTGDFSQNVSLSSRRAEAVVNHLIRSRTHLKGRLTPVGVGMAAPVATNSTEEGRAQNRRVEMVVR